MKKCTIHPELISRLVDGDMEVSEKARLLSHMAHCDKCEKQYAAYRFQSELIAASFSEQMLPVAAMAQLTKTNLARRGIGLPRFACGLAGALVILCVAIFYRNRDASRSLAAKSTLPVYVLESMVPSTMNHPLSSIVYYEEMAQQMVHSQFVPITPRIASAGVLTDKRCVQALYYESELFFDNAVSSAMGTGENGESAE